MTLTSSDGGISLWLTVGLPISVVLISQLGAIAVAWAASRGTRKSERARFLASERRTAYAAHLAALETMRGEFARILIHAFSAGKLEVVDRDRMITANETCEVASNETLLLCGREYIAASRNARKAIGRIEAALVEIDARSIGIRPASDQTPKGADEIIEIATNAGTQEIGALRCRPPVAWDHFDVSSASVMGPPVRQ